MSGLVAAAALIAAAVVGASLASGGWPSASSGPPVVAPPSPSPQAASDVEEEAPAASAEDSREALDAVVAGDAATVSLLAGAWVPQVSSKRVGLEADGIVYDEEAILADHLRLRAGYAGAVLLPSDRFATFSSSGFYVTVIASSYTTPAAANAWCDRAGLPADACFAKRLATSVGNGASTVPR